MTAPRRILPGQFYLVTRRTLLRMFLLRPSPAVNRMFEYCLAEAAKKHDIDLIAWCAMSNHYHAVIYDPERNVPAFIERFHRMLAKALNRHHGRFESFWSREQTCLTRLVTMNDVFDKVVYVLANPAAAHLVDNIAHWPGSSSWTRMGRDAKTVKRPEDGYFCADGLMPEEVELCAVAPRGLGDESYEQWIKRVRDAVKKRQDELEKERQEQVVKERRQVLGAKRVLAMKPTDTPKTEAPRWNLHPHLACKDDKRMEAERRELEEFRANYREMRRRLREGDSEVKFPEGTYRMRLLGLPCKGCPEAVTTARAKPPKKSPRAARRKKAA